MADTQEERKSGAQQLPPPHPSKLEKVELKEKKKGEKRVILHALPRETAK